MNPWLYFNPRPAQMRWEVCNDCDVCGEHPSVRIEYKDKDGTVYTKVKLCAECIRRAQEAIPKIDTLKW